MTTSQAEATAKEGAPAIRVLARPRKRECLFQAFRLSKAVVPLSANILPGTSGGEGQQSVGTGAGGKQIVGPHTPTPTGQNLCRGTSWTFTPWRHNIAQEDRASAGSEDRCADVVEKT
jgi:hypothetical protein